MATATVTEAATRTLLVGYGNSLRGDDALGPYIVERLAERLPGVATRIVQQLTPELAAELAEVDKAIFVDASAESGEAVQVQAIEPRRNMEGFTHVADVAGLLELARSLFGRAPRAWLVSVAGSEFGFVEGLSPEAMEETAGALRTIRELLCTKSA